MGPGPPVKREEPVLDRKVTDEEIAAAAAYEDLHVPALFQQWAPRVLDAAAIRPGERVLDVACGTGILAREVSSHLGGSGHVAGVDISPGMLSVASRLGPDIEWRVAPAEALPYETNTFDAVVSQFGLMFFEDRAAAVREMQRVLAPGGRVAVSVWASLDESEAYPIEVEVLEHIAGHRAADALRAPFVLGDPDELRRLLEDARLESVEIETHVGRACFPTVRTMVEADLRGWLPVMGVVLSEDEIERILSETEQRLDQYVTPNGSVEFDTPALIVTGCKGIS